jgi:hypothetical protein
MQALIPGLRGSITHRMSTELYQRHRDTGNGTCCACGYRTPCPARRHAMAVIYAAGENPVEYDTRRPDIATSPGNGRRQPEKRAVATLNYTGYHLGGRGRNVNWDGLFYERDSP